MEQHKKTISKLYREGQSLKQIGEYLGVCQQTVWLWMRKWGFKTRGRPTADKWEKRRAEIEFLYHEQRLSQGQIAAYFQVSQAMVYRVMKRLGIAKRARARVGNEHYNYKDGKSNRQYRTLIIKDKCSRCGTAEDLGIHHKNDDHYDNRLENLEVLCNSCHMSETKRKWWAAKRAGQKLPKSNGPVGWNRKARSRQS